MSDRALRFAARMIAVGLLGVAWTIGTLAMVIILQTPEPDLRLRVMGYAGLAPVAVMLIYVIFTDLADWRSSRKQQEIDDD